MAVMSPQTKCFCLQQSPVRHVKSQSKFSSHRHVRLNPADRNANLHFSRKGYMMNQQASLIVTAKSCRLKGLTRIDF